MVTIPLQVSVIHASVLCASSRPFIATMRNLPGPCFVATTTNTSSSAGKKRAPAAKKTRAPAAAGKKKSKDGKTKTRQRVSDMQIRRQLKAVKELKARGCHGCSSTLPPSLVCVCLLSLRRRIPSNILVSKSAVQLAGACFRGRKLRSCLSKKMATDEHVPYIGEHARNTPPLSSRRLCRKGSDSVHRQLLPWWCFLLL